MKAYQFREKARENLTGKWGKAAVITLIYILITSLLSFGLSFLPFFGNIVLLILEVPMAYGVSVSFIKLRRNEQVGYIDFLETAFSSIGPVWKVSGNIFLKVLLPFCLLIATIVLFVFFATFFGVMFAIGTTNPQLSVSSVSLVFLIGACIIAFGAYIGIYVWLIVKTLLYSQSYFILYDNPNATGKEIVEKSEKLMKGNRWHYFCLGLSFIGWILLSTLSFGIGFLWVVPYMLIADIFFYENLINNDNNVEIVDNKSN